jgi:hypothetical protein
MISPLVLRFVCQSVAERQLGVEEAGLEGRKQLLVRVISKSDHLLTDSTPQSRQALLL